MTSWLKLSNYVRNKATPKTTTINALVSLSLDSATVDSDLIQIKYQANDKDYSHEGLVFIQE